MKCCFCILEKVNSLFKSIFLKDDIDNIFIDIDNEVIK